MFRVSLANVLALPTTGLYPSTQSPAYPVENLRTPERPGMPWRSTAVTQQTVVIRLATRQRIDVVALLDANFAAASVQGNATDAWTTPAWSLGADPGVNPWNRARACALDVGDEGDVAVTYLRLVIPAQTPVDGKPYFSLGGIWAGLWTYPPRDVQWGYTIVAPEPFRDEQPEHHGWRERSRLGARRTTTISAHRQAIAGRPVGLDDQVGDWRTLDASLWAAGCFLAQIELDPSQIWVARLVSEPEWSVDGLYPDAPLELEEVVG